jgi:hypothetical protein
MRDNRNCGFPHCYQLRDNMSLRGDNMKSVLRILSLLLLASTIACSNSPSAKEGAAAQNVNFRISSNHFVKNTYKGETNPSYLVIRDYASFDSLFGIAAVMGMDSSKLIKEEDMKNRFVLSIIYQGNDIHEFSIEKITLKDRQLQVYYSSRVTTPNASWTCNCHVTALIENCDFSSILLFENGQPVSSAVVKEL